MRRDCRHRLEARAEALVRAAEEARGASRRRGLGRHGRGGRNPRRSGRGGRRLASAFEVAVGPPWPQWWSKVTPLPHARRWPAWPTVTSLVRSSPSRSGAPRTRCRCQMPELPSGADSVRRHVRPRFPSVAGLLDRLLVDAVAVQGGWRAAVDLVLERPDLVVVTKEGDRFGASGWTLHAGAAPGAEAAAEVAQARGGRGSRHAQRVAARDRRGPHRRRSGRRAESLEATREAERAADRRVALERTVRRLHNERQVLHEEWAEALRHRTGVSERLERDGAHLAELQERLPELEAAATVAGSRLSEADSAPPAARRAPRRGDHASPGSRGAGRGVDRTAHRVGPPPRRCRAPTRGQRGGAGPGSPAPPPARSRIDCRRPVGHDSSSATPPVWPSCWWACRSCGPANSATCGRGESASNGCEANERTPTPA